MPNSGHWTLAFPITNPKLQTARNQNSRMASDRLTWGRPGFDVGRETLGACRAASNS